MISIGTTLLYKAFDQESYSRGYGAHFEDRTSRVSELRYKVTLNPDSYVSQIIGINNILSENKNPSVGDTISIEFWDGEEGRGYGWFKNRSDATVREILYKMEDGETIKTEDIKEVKAEPTKKE